MLEAHDLKKEFPSGEGMLIVFEHLEFQAAAGEFIAIVGRSGSGKSTLLYQLGLLDTPSAGSIVVDGVDAAHLSRHKRTQTRLQSFGYVFQDYGLLPEMSALENVMVPLLMQGFFKPRAKKIAHDAIAQMRLEQYVSVRPAKLSGGQQQRVSIARAIAHKPPYLLADEPTANLDSTTAKEVLDFITSIHKAGTAVIMISHEREVLPHATRILELQKLQLADVTSLYRSAARSTPLATYDQ